MIQFCSIKPATLLQEFARLAYSHIYRRDNVGVRPHCVTCEHIYVPWYMFKPIYMRNVAIPTLLLANKLGMKSANFALELIGAGEAKRQINITCSSVYIFRFKII